MLGYGLFWLAMEGGSWVVRGKGKGQFQGMALAAQQLPGGYQVVGECAGAGHIVAPWQRLGKTLPLAD